MYDSEKELVPNRRIYFGDLRTIITFCNCPDEDVPDEGYYVIEIEVFDKSRLIRKERIVTDNLNIFEDPKLEES